MANLHDFYQSNERFRLYVDRCAANNRVPVEEVLGYALTRKVASAYMDQASGAAVASTYAPVGECV
ncbi:MAG: hypothetical protein NC123_18280 [Butyrivibrio sp.]|nr:hypothetical protein [Acetatifactor muris]MCM1561460.1 hypothetical protein [Butyrivibrio sp.]